MKPYIHCFKLLLLLCIVLFVSSCEEDPTIPAMPKYRYFQSLKVKTNIPKDFDMYNFQQNYLFSIGDQAYFRARDHNGYVDGKEIEGPIIYKYDTTQDHWTPIWYLTRDKLYQLEQSGQYEEAQRLRSISEILSNQSQAGGTYNGKGYCLTNLHSIIGILEFNPSNNTWTILPESSPSDFYNYTQTFTTSLGIFVLDEQYPPNLYQYSFTNKQWSKIGRISSTFYEYYSRYGSKLYHYKDKLYSFQNSVILISSFPYTTYEEKYPTFPKDYGWVGDNDIPVDSYSGNQCIFTANDKMYIKNDKLENCFYEINLSDYSTSFAFIKENNYSYFYGLFPMFVIGNKAYCYSEASRELIEITL